MGDTNEGSGSFMCRGMHGFVSGKGRGWYRFFSLVSERVLADVHNTYRVGHAIEEDVGDCDPFTILFERLQGISKSSSSLGRCTLAMIRAEWAISCSGTGVWNLD